MSAGSGGSSTTARKPAARAGKGSPKKASGGHGKPAAHHSATKHPKRRKHVKHRRHKKKAPVKPIAPAPVSGLPGAPAPPAIPVNPPPPSSTAPPAQEAAITLAQARRLLWRAGFGPTAGQAEALAGQPIEEASTASRGRRAQRC